MAMVRVSLGEFFRVVRAESALAEGDKLMAEYPELAAELGRPEFQEVSFRSDTSAEGEPNDVGHDGQTCECPTCRPGLHQSEYSDFGPGRQVVDSSARERIEALQGELKAAGVQVDPGRQLYATGTRMARIGYETQSHRAVEHSEKASLRDVVEDLSGAVRNERREDLEVTAGELAKTISLDRRISALGFRLSEQAIRGLLARLESPALGYVLGLRDRVVEASRQQRATSLADAGEPEARALALQVKADREQIVSVLRRECERSPETKLKLRTRWHPGDVYAVVSPSYSAADAPELLAQLAGELPREARASYSYDPASTAWEVRASVWTPTPVEEQCVGEPFEGYVSFQSRDNGTSRLRGGGGVVMLACLNAGTYVAEGSNLARTHRGGILVDVGAMTTGATAAIRALCAAWGSAKGETIEREDLVGVPLSQAILGIWWGELGDRKGQLAGVLPGRSSRHVEGLTEAYFAERRDGDRLVKSDLAQAWTRYIQGQPGPIRREAECAVGAWLVCGKPVRYEARA